MQRQLHDGMFEAFFPIVHNIIGKHLTAPWRIHLSVILPDFLWFLSDGMYLNQRLGGDTPNPAPHKPPCSYAPVDDVRYKSAFISRKKSRCVRAWLKILPRSWAGLPVTVYPNFMYRLVEAKNKKRADPMKEALKKWQKEKRLRQIQEKKTKKEPFRPVSNVSRQLSEFQHSFQNNNNQMNTSKIKTNDVIHHKVVASVQNAQKNVSLNMGHQFMLR